MIKRIYILMIIVAILVFTGCSTSDEKIDDYSLVVTNASDDNELQDYESEVIKLELELADLKDIVAVLEADNKKYLDTIAKHEVRNEEIRNQYDNVVHFLGANRYTELEVPPQNEAVDDESFMMFLDEFKEAISNRDLEYVISHMDQNSLEPYMDSVPDFDEFKREYGLVGDEVDNAIFWEIMEELLDLGFEDIGVEGTKAYYAPYFGDYMFIVESFDDFSELWGTCIGENVNIRNKPNIDSVIIDQVSYLVLEYGKDQDYDSDWSQVVLPDGRTGYIHNDFIRSDFDYRCIFKFVDGEWLLTMLMAGC